MSTSEAENVTHRYNKFMEAVQHANKTLLPKKSKKKWDDPASDPRVINSRKVLNTAKDNYHLDPSENTHMYVDELNLRNFRRAITKLRKKS